jgi:acyl-CoA thioester hydrolase
MKNFKAIHKVRSYECDSYGHVNNSIYLNYLEYARMEALWELGFTLDKMKQAGYLVVVRRIELDYKHPLFMGDKIEIHTKLSDSRNSSGTFSQQIINLKNNKLAAEAKVTWVFLDLRGKPIPIPDEIKSAFEI